MSVSEKYRPQTWDALVGQDHIVREAERIRQNGGFAGHAFFISGPSGTGKTTIARLIAREVAEPWATAEMDAAELTADRIREIDREMRSPPLCGQAWAYLVNEVHGLNRDQIRKLLTRLDPVPAHVVWVFTTTKVAQRDLFDQQIDAHPFTERCTQWETKVAELSFAFYAQSLARDSGLDGKSFDAYVGLVRKHEGSLRGVLDDVCLGRMN